MLFQAMGARYTFVGALRHLCVIGSRAQTERLRLVLGEKYDGEAVLYHKGRAALAEAVRLVTDGSGKVAVSGLTCYSLVQAVEAAGAEAVYVDINTDELHFGADELAQAFKQHPDIKAVIVQNMLGIPVDIAGIQNVVHKHGALLIEDLAHSTGAHYKDGREVGTVGDITMLSFGKDKAIDTVNGGALIVRSETHKAGLAYPKSKVGLHDQFRDRIYPLVAWTARKLYPVGLGRYVMAGAIRVRLVVRSADGAVNSNEALPAWQAHLAYEQFVRLNETVAARQAKVELYRTLLKRELPAGTHTQGASLIRVPLLIENRDEVIRHLAAVGVHAEDVWYDIPVSPKRFYGRAHYSETENPVSVDTAARLVNLPTHEGVSDHDIQTIAAVINKVGRS